MRRTTRLLIASLLAAAVAAPLAAGADRMWTGFHDDPILRWDPARTDAQDRATSANAAILRTLVTWANVAPTRPASPKNPFDPAYKLDDVDELVRSAQARGQEVLITIWGTPKWANGGKTPNIAPKNMADLQNFATALASRYSGRTPGYPFVRFYGIWNESNFAQFLSPQFDAKGNIVGPKTYAKIAAAAYAGIKAGNPKAKVAIGETASHGRDKKSATSRQDTVRPGTFARLVAQANKKLKFDAYAHHPYPYPVSMKPNQKVMWPNVNMESLPRFQKELGTWFGRKNVEIWITEYGHETKPGEPTGVTEPQQAAYVKQALAMAKSYPWVSMFIWFVFEDSPGSLWQSGLYRTNGAAKPALSAWRSGTSSVDARNPKIKVKGGTRNPKATLITRDLCVNNAVGVTVGLNVKGPGGYVIQPTSTLASDCSVTFTAAGLTIAKGKSVVLNVEPNTKAGVGAKHTVTFTGT